MGLGGGLKNLMKKEKSRASSDDEEEEMGFGLFDEYPSPPGAPPPPIASIAAAVTTKGSVNATFRVPGLISVPSDGVAHNVTIVKLTPEAKLLWLSVPSVDTKVHLSVRQLSHLSLVSFSSGLL